MTDEELRKIFENKFEDYSVEEKIMYLLEKYDYLSKLKYEGNEEILRLEELSKIEEALFLLGFKPNQI